jgi:hypothetical protein
MAIDTYLTLALILAATVAAGIALSIAGRLLVTVPTYVWRVVTGTLSASRSILDHRDRPASPRQRDGDASEDAA